MTAVAKARRLTALQKIQAAAKYSLGGITVKQLAAEFKVSEDTMSRALKKMGVEKGSQQSLVEAKVAERLAKEAEATAADIAQKVKATNDETYRMLSAYQKLSAESVAKARSGSHAIGTTINDAKALEIHIRAVRLAHEGRLKALGVKDDGNGEREELPTLGIHEMDAEQIRAAREQQSNEDGDAVGKLEGTLEPAAAPAEDEKVSEGDDTGDAELGTGAKPQ